MMVDFLEPLSDGLLAHVATIPRTSIGNNIQKFTHDRGLPSLETADMAILGVPECRGEVNCKGEKISLDHIRKAFYDLFPGSWDASLIDLGDVKTGHSISDTYFALQTIIKELIRQKVIPLIIGGSQDLTYAQYRAYDSMVPMVNIVNIDARFNLGNTEVPLNNESFMGKIIVEKPYNLFNYAVLGYQTYFNSQEEIQMMDKLHFESYRLGDLADFSLAEPVLRDANLVSLDLCSVKSSELSTRQKGSPNGFDGKEICALARYAGISSKVSSFGVYGYKPSDDDKATSMLIAQILWYFIEGFYLRAEDRLFLNEQDFQKFTVLIEGEALRFYKSTITGRWWIEIPINMAPNNKLKKHTLLPCTYNDYRDACQNKVPDRWYKAIKRNGV